MPNKYRPRLDDKSKGIVQAYKHRNKATSRVLVVGDLHLPFVHKDYLQHCIDTYNEFGCDKVVFIGDIIDNHFSSYHESDPDGFGAGEELDRAIQALKPWYEAFPEAYVVVGNHDRLIQRKAYSSGVPKRWIKSFGEVLGVPDWEFVEEIEIDNVLYIHGEGGKAHIKCRREIQSIVQGHLHSDCYVQWFVGKTHRIFGMQVGCGIDAKSYAMAYGKRGNKPALACGVVLDSCKAFPVLMDLK